MTGTMTTTRAQMITNQIDDLSKRGLSDQCYLALTNFVCFWCNPNTNDFLGVYDSSFNIGGSASLFVCPSFCDKMFNLCFDDLDKIASNTNILTSREFCEYMDFDGFFQNPNDLFPDFRVYVTNSNQNGCFGGAKDEDIVEVGGVCIPEPSGNRDGDPIIFPPSSDGPSTVAAPLATLAVSGAAAAILL